MPALDEEMEDLDDLDLDAEPAFDFGALFGQKKDPVQPKTESQSSELDLKRNTTEGGLTKVNEEMEEEEKEEFDPCGVSSNGGGVG